MQQMQNAAYYDRRVKRHVVLYQLPPLPRCTTNTNILMCMTMHARRRAWCDIHVPV